MDHKTKSNMKGIVVIVAVLVIFIGGAVWASSRPGPYDEFATCIKDSGAEFFGAFWCPHCQAQKQEFGRSAKKLPYIECSTPDGKGQTDICKENTIESYPTWIFPDGIVIAPDQEPELCPQLPSWH